MLDVNEYFEGKVKSIAFQGDTLPATVGVMAPGRYEFATSEQETMTVVSGVLMVKLPGAQQFERFVAGDSFTVAAEQRFAVDVAADTAYLCTYG